MRKQEWLGLLKESGRQASYFASLCRAMRRVLRSDQGPLEIPPQDKSVWICMCGLSANLPYCDGSHKRTRDEEAGKTYLYDATGHRTEIPAE
jgi:CDGSH iron-sulfur domain-containing protein 3